MPRELPTEPRIVWRRRLTSPALAGLAATPEEVIVADRDAADQQDLFRSLDAETGDIRWTYAIPSTGRLDYGNSARATPLIDGDRVIFYNAFGMLHVVKRSDGTLLWKKDVLSEFQGRDPRNAWGTCSSPLIVDGRLIVNPGGPTASLVALDPATGAVVWKSPGELAAFSSFIEAAPHGVRQLIGYDKVGLVGVCVEDGARLWSLKSPKKGDFNVPTPIIWRDQLVVSTENNGTRLLRFDHEGRIDPTPVAVNDELAPDTHTPVVAGDRLFGVWLGLHALDLNNQLESRWMQEEKAFEDYAVLVAHDDRLLAISKYGELILIDAAADAFRAISRWQPFADDAGVYSHPAIVENRLYLRGSDEIICVLLGDVPTDTR